MNLIASVKLIESIISVKEMLEESEKGRLHDLVDVFYSMREDWKSAFFNIGVQSLDLEFDERIQIIEHFEQKQQKQALEFEDWIQSLLKVDPNDSDYFYNRLYTNMGIETALLVGAGMGAIKGVVGIGKTERVLRKVSRNFISEKHIIDTERKISSWLGEGIKYIQNQPGDSIFLSKDGLRCVRFDFYRTKPHISPHAHIEFKANNKWIKSGPIYPTDVPHK